jgi:hypothetical protein
VQAARKSVRIMANLNGSISFRLGRRNQSIVYPTEVGFDN